MIKRFFIIGGILIIAIVVVILGINYYVCLSVKKEIISDNYENIDDIDCILVLGASAKNGKPSPMLEDRLNKAIKLYEDGLAPKIIMSGDHGKDNYDEVNVMKNYAIEKGIDSKDIFMDHAGFSTYESIYRAKEIFEAKKIVIVTQEYHLYRALYIAKKIGIEALGITSDERKHSGQIKRELREILARDKDFIQCFFKPTPTYLGESIPVSGDGDVTNDRNTQNEIVLTIKKGQNKDKAKRYYQNESRNLYLVGIDEVETNKNMNLQELLDKQGFETVLNNILERMEQKDIYKDGGTKLYQKDDIKILLCNTIDGNKDVYIGDNSLTYEDNFCK